MQISLYYKKEDRYLFDLLETTARRERKSRSAMILSILEEYFEAEKKIGEILKDMKAIDTQQLHEVLSIQRNDQEGRKLGEILLKKGFIDEAQLQRALELQKTLNGQDSRLENNMSTAR